MLKQGSTWDVYLLKCLDNSYYIGITNNLDKRMKTHQSGKGSKYVRARGFCCLIGSKHCFNMSEALKLEYKLKQLSQEEKLDFFLKE